MSLPATDNFNRGAQADLGANWTFAYNSAHTQALNNAVGDNGGDYNIAYWGADSFGNDQYSQFLYKTGAFNGVACRVSGSGGTRTGYYVLTGISGSRLAKVVNGTITDLIASGSLANPNDGDTVKITAVGTTVEVFYAGVSQGSVTDSSIASGSAGLIFFGNTATADDWEGGNVAGAGPPVVWECKPNATGHSRFQVLA